MIQIRQKYRAYPILPIKTVVRFILQKKCLFWWVNVADDFGDRIIGEEGEIKEVASKLNTSLHYSKL